MFLVFDIGGTNMRLAVSRDGKNIEEPKILKTPKDFDEGMLLFKKTALNLSDGEKIKAAAGGIAGPLDGKKEMLVNSPNLAGWVKKPLKKALEKFFGAPVFIENDAALSGLGEATYGSGQGYKIIVYITISTGVGGARIVNSHIDTNALGFEPGHQIIEKDGVL
ncbi:ROK family protein, partial [Candidatus Daviesbacteria bacterium]|nr:ROK family protein [Candidatus Daviesbacteria bacterium]